MDDPDRCPHPLHPVLLDVGLDGRSACATNRAGRAKARSDALVLAVEQRLLRAHRRGIGRVDLLVRPEIDCHHNAGTKLLDILPISPK